MMNHYKMLLVFIFGAASALVCSLISQFFQDQLAYKILLPLVHDLQVVDDDLHDIRKALTPSKPSEVQKSSLVKREAVMSMNSAIEMRRQGKHDKAMKLFEHALSLHPKNPDILTHYGEFLEENRSDLIEADKLYARALACLPQHTRALENRKRTRPIVEEMDRNWLKRLDDKRDKLMKIPDYDPSLIRVKKEAYFQYVYHTVGIEGNTMTLGQTRSILETKMAVAGKSIIEHNEILGLDAALKYINSTLVHRIGGITVQDILEIHRRVMGYVDPVEGGSFRRTQVYVAEHTPPSPRELDYLMEELVQWLNSESALKLHPVKFAALAHYKLVYIHPFLDGNGRTSRLLMNMILMQVGFPPVIIRKHDRYEYYETIENANEGDIRPFIRFIAECTDRTLDYYLWATSQRPGLEIPALARTDGRTIIINDDED